MNLRERILATRAEAERRLALAEAATPRPWRVVRRLRMDDGDYVVVTEDDLTIADWLLYPDARHIAANDPTTVAAEQRRIIDWCDGDLGTLDWCEAVGMMARFPDATFAERSMNQVAMTTRKRVEDRYPDYLDDEEES